MKNVKVLILRTAGTNCDQETLFAFQQVGASPELVHINRISEDPALLDKFHILALPGGFTYGDDIASGKVLANEIRNKFFTELEKFFSNGKLAIGICNGFQVLVKAGYLPQIHDKKSNKATLTHNDCGKFEDRWIHLKYCNKNEVQKCIWTKDLPAFIELPIAHGEGKFVPDCEETRQLLWDNNQVVFQYVNPDGKTDGFPWNPNGSVDSIAGICDNSGRIFGLMPHPERFIRRTHHPCWTREEVKSEPAGLAIFRNGVTYAKENL